MKVAFRPLSEAPSTEVIALMNNPRVRKHMPLLSHPFDEITCEEFFETKEKLWKEHGFGPWAFFTGGCFVGWGGLQPEGGDVEIALVLHPDFWGLGKLIYEKIILYAKSTHQFDSLIILFPPSRSRIKGILNLGFEKDGEISLEGHLFYRYRKTL